MAFNIQDTADFRRLYSNASQGSGGVFDVGGGTKYQLSQTGTGYDLLEGDETVEAKKLADLKTSMQPEARPILTPNYSAQLGSLQAPNEAQIRQDALSQAQAAIDATNAVYQQEYARLQKEGSDRLQETRSIATSAGLAGSPFQGTMVDKTQGETAKVLDARAKERAAEVQNILARAEGIATQKYQNAIANFQNERAFLTSQRDKEIADTKATQEAAKTKAFSTITNLAKGGFSLDELPAEEYKKILQDSGVSDFEAKALYNQSAPQSNGKTEIQGDQVVTYYIDPRTGKPTFATTPLPDSLKTALPADLQVVTTDSGVFVFNKNKPEMDANGNYIMQRVGNAKDSGFTLSKGQIRYDSEGNPIAFGVPDDEGMGQKIVKINGVDYVQNSDGSYSLPNTPTTGADQEKVAILQDKIKLIDDLLNSKGLKGAVGTYGLSRWTPFSADKSDRQEFAAGVNQLINKETIDTLVNLKERGGTLGALSDQERLLLQSAASKIGTWMIKDDTGNPTGKFAVSEDTFKKELQSIKDMAQKAIEKAGGGDEIDGFLESFNQPLSMGVNGSEVKKIASAIGQFESGGNYKAQGPKTKNGDRAYGRYQIMGNNIPAWSKEILGRTVSLKEFLSSPEIQDQIAHGKMQQYYKKYGTVEDVASLWFSGKPVSKAGNAKDVIGTSVPKYVKNVRSIYNSLT